MRQDDGWKEIKTLPARQPSAPMTQQPQDDGWRESTRFAAPGAPTPPRDYTWSEVPRQAVRNFPSSLGGVYMDTLSAITSPIETGKAMAQMLGGAAISALPEGGQQWLMSVANDPAKMQESINMARAAGGQIAQDYGTAAGFRRKLAEDPAAVLADFSILFSGGAAATARTAPTASAALRFAEDLTNPLALAPALAETRIPGTQTSLSQVGTTARDFVTGAGGERVARNIITEALGPQNVPTIAQLTDPRFRDMSAAEAVLASGVNRPQFQALGAQVARSDPQNLYFNREEAQRAQRQQSLAAVTPDEQRARAFRSEAADPYYQAAREQVVSVTPDLRSSLNALPNNILNEARKLARLDPEGPGQLNLAGDVIDGRTMGYISAAIRDELAKPQATTTTGRTQRRMLGERLDVITREMESQIPDFRTGRQVFAELSPEVNQAQVLSEMQRRLTGPLDQERPGQFMRVLGEGEEAMLRRSTGSPRYQEGDLMNILSAEQGRVVTDVSDQLTRQAEMARLAQRGQEGLLEILAENRPLARRIPGMLQREVLLANRAISLLEGRVSKTTQDALRRAMFSGEDLNRFMNSVPSTERRIVNQVIDQVFDAQNLRNVGLIERLQEEEEQ